jgi:DNA-binding NtrC family response regulator
VRQAATRLGHAVSITPSALDALIRHSWPGNVRELRNAVERAAVLGTGGPLEPRDFALGNGNGKHPAPDGTGGPSTSNGSMAGVLDLKTQVEAVERQAILKALEASGGNRRQAASLLGVSLRTLFYKMRRLPVR